MSYPHHHYHWHTPHPDLEGEWEREMQIQHDPTIADGYVRYACLGLWRCLVVNVMTCVGLCACVCECAYPSIHCSNYPGSVWGKLSHFAVTERQDRASYNLNSPLLIVRLERGKLLSVWDRKNETTLFTFVKMTKVSISGCIICCMTDT